MSNIVKVNEALTEWAMNVAKSVLPQIAIPHDSTIGKMMNFLGVDPRSYSVYDELGFIVEPSIKMFVAPTLEKYLGGMSDDQVKDMAFTYASAFRKRAAEKGYVNVFGVQLGESAFVGLQDILNEKFNV